MVPLLIICTTCILLDICGGRLAEKVAFAIEIVKEIMPPSNIFMKICSGGLKQIYIVKDPSQKDSTTRHAQLTLPVSCWICFLLSLPRKRNLVTT